MKRKINLTKDQKKIIDQNNEDQIKLRSKIK